MSQETCLNLSRSIIFGEEDSEMVVGFFVDLYSASVTSRRSDFLLSFF